MAKHAYVAYKLYITRFRQPDELLNVGNFDSQGSDLLTLFHAFLNDITVEPLRDGRRERYLSISYLNPRGRTVRFKTEYGRFGISGSLIDTTSGDTTHSYHEDESAVVETRNLLTSPTSGNWAILLAERYGGRGSVTMVLSEFKKAFQQRFNSDNFLFKYDGLMDLAAWEKYVDNADMTELKIKRWSPASDIADPVIAESVGHVVSHVKPRRSQKRFPRTVFQKLVTQEISAQSIVGIPPREGDEVELVLNDGIQQRSIILGEVETPILAYILSDDQNDRPSDGIVHDAMLAKVADAKRTLGLTLTHDWKDGDWGDDMLSVKMEAIREIS
ncbi:hypothetical protein [Actinophytocola sediminis]